jgi:WD40 repeat protein
MMSPKMGIHDLVSCFGILLLLTACSGQEAPPPAAATAAPSDAAALSDAAPEPKIIVQLGHQAPVSAVRWLDGGRHLASLAADGSLVFWNVAGGAILDQAQIPLVLVPQPGQQPSPLRFHAFIEGPVAGTLAVVYAGEDVDAAGQACPGAHHAGTPWCTYVVDLATRGVRADAGVPIPAGEASHWPLSPDGRLRPEPNHGNGIRGYPDMGDDYYFPVDTTCTSKQRCRYGVTVFVTGGSEESRVLVGDSRNFFLDAEVSPDGLRLLRVGDFYDFEGGGFTRAEIIDMESGSREPGFDTVRDYHHVRWLDEKRYLLGSNGYSASNDTEDALAGFPPARLIDPACAARGDCPAIESRWQMRTTDAGGLVALGSLEYLCFKGPGQHGADNVFCTSDSVDAGDGDTSTDPPATGLAFRAADARDWRELVVPALADQRITAIETSSDGLQLAVATSAWVRTDSPEAGKVLRLWLLDIPEGAVTAQRRLLEIVDPIAGETIRALSFSADGRRIVFTLDAAAQADEATTELYVVDTDAAANVRTLPIRSQRVVAIGNDRVLGLEDGALLDLDTGRIIAQIPLRTAPLGAGWIERSRLMWTSTEDGRILFWDSGDGTLVLTLHALPDNRYFAVAPGGRYDTNLSADTQLVRWLVPDAPWQSLAAQTFMRDYYEPGLYRRLLDCRANDTCASAFKPLPAVASLNRVLPEVRISSVRAGRDAAEAVVTVEVREGVDPDAPNGKTRSGIYNPRLFRNGRLVAMAPVQQDTVDADPAQWRARNAVQVTDGVHRLEFTVPVPTQAGEETQEFSAYAFNEDRIKGETETFQWTREPIAPRPRRAYVLAIGIDDYDTPRFRLNYAVADARLMASRLSAIPGYETHSMVLAAERGADGRRTRVDRATLARVLSLLAGNADREATLAALQVDGIDASMLQPATPDDAVIVSFSGHGWANPQGDFYLIPGDGRWPEGSETPDLSTVFATADLVAPFQVMHANEITLVIDACHSAASVADGRFKPGPMGDSGLGQLAFDKGIRILAATQADDVALEDARLGQGLLTYALAEDGLGGGQADLDGDRSIRTDEWLAYAVQRMPSLANDARVGRINAAGEGSRAITFSDLPAEAPARRVQQPALFDFNPKASTLVLREETP